MQPEVKISQKKLLKDVKKCKRALKNEMDKNNDLFLKLQEYKDKLKNCEKEKEYLRKNYLLKFQKIEMRTLHIMDLFKFVESMDTNREISHFKAYDYIDLLLRSLKFHIRVLKSF